MGRERRRFERIESLVNVEYFSKTGQIRGFSLTRDASENGLGLPVNSKIPVGTRLELKLLLGGNIQREIPVVAKVVWSKRNDEHWKSEYSAGLEFLNITAGDREILLKYVKGNRWIKSDFERSLEEDKIPILGERGEFLL